MIKNISRVQYNEEAEMPLPIEMLMPEQDEYEQIQSDAKLIETLHTLLMYFSFLACGFVAGVAFS